MRQHAVSTVNARLTNYEGEMRKFRADNGDDVLLRHGHGTFQFDNQFFQYEGDYVNNIKHGHGRLSIGDGSYYEGDFREGEMTGFGLRQWPDGSSYQGAFLEGEFHGRGTLLSAKDRSKYEGAWRNNRRQGQGELVRGDGDRFVGNFHRHLFHGAGQYAHADGRVFQGTFACGMREGDGVVTDNDGARVLFRGQWHEDKRHGQGESFDPVSGLRFVGTFADDQPARQATSTMLTFRPYSELLAESQEKQQQQQQQQDSEEQQSAPQKSKGKRSAKSPTGSEKVDVAADEDDCWNDEVEVCLGSKFPDLWLALLEHQPASAPPHPDDDPSDEIDPALREGDIAAHKHVADLSQSSVSTFVVTEETGRTFSFRLERVPDQDDEPVADKASAKKSSAKKSGKAGASDETGDQDQEPEVPKRAFFVRAQPVVSSPAASPSPSPSVSSAKSSKSSKKSRKPKTKPDSSDADDQSEIVLVEQSPFHSVSRSMECGQTSFEGFFLSAECAPGLYDLVISDDTRQCSSVCRTVRKRVRILTSEELADPKRLKAKAAAAKERQKSVERAEKELAKRRQARRDQKEKAERECQKQLEKEQKENAKRAKK